jgi:hypothetical protein
MQVRNTPSLDIATMLIAGAPFPPEQTLRTARTHIRAIPAWCLRVLQTIGHVVAGSWKKRVHQNQGGYSNTSPGITHSPAAGRHNGTRFLSLPTDAEFQIMLSELRYRGIYHSRPPRLMRPGVEFASRVTAALPRSAVERRVQVDGAHVGNIPRALGTIRRDRTADAVRGHQGRADRPGGRTVAHPRRV